MTIKRPILLLLWFFASCLCMHAGIKGDPFSEILPSVQTEQELQDLTEANGDDFPELRARPTDIGDSEHAQKIPLADCGAVEFFILAIILSIYALLIHRKQTLNKALVSFIFLFMVGAGSMIAQTIKAVADNYYLRPGGLYTLTITVNDNPGDCANTLEDLILTLNNTPSVSGVTWTKMSGNKVRVLVPLAARGSDVLQYTIKCPNNPATSSAKVYLNFSERPDFVDDATCTVDPPETVWDIKRSHISDYPVYYLATPLAGDMNGDGKPEIVTFGHKRIMTLPSGTEPTIVNNSATVTVFNNELKLVKEFAILNTASTDTVGTDNYFGNPLAIGDIDGDGQGEILVGTGYLDGYKLRCYKMDGTLKWVSHDKNGAELSFFAYGTVHPNFASSATPVIADIDGDNLVEVFIGDRFFDGKTGLLLATIPEGKVTTATPLIADMPTSFNWGRGHRQQTFGVGGGTYQPVLADVNGDGRIDAVCGNATYDIKINRANPDLSTTSLISAVALPDGLTSVADINGDGVLDVIVVTASRTSMGTGYVYQYYPTDKTIPTTMYAWDGATNKVFGIVQPKSGDGITAGSGGSRAFIGDIDGDGKPEICFTYVNMMAAYKYNGTGFTSLWNGKTTTDRSGATTMTMFDFNLDGEAELVYRDETHIRILDKNGNNVKDKDLVDAIFDCFSATHTEYPIVIDLDGDGHAEIIVSGRENETDPTVTGTHLMAFTSKTPNMWAPARQVWNQHGYNPLWINKDLSVPRYPADPTNEAGYTDGTVYKPFNSFLQQAGWLNVEGKSFNKAPDLTFQLSKNQRLTYDEGTDVMTIKAFLTNTGSEDYTGDILLSLYTYTGLTGNYFHVYSSGYTNKTLNLYGELELDLVIPDWSKISFPTYDNLVLSVNLVNDAPNAPKPFYKNQKECIEWNNMTDKISYISGSVVMCQGDQAELVISPLGTYDCYWYTLDAGGNKKAYPSAGSEVGDRKMVTKQTSGREVYLIDIYKKNTSNKISAISDTLFVYQSADTLVWTGKINMDWHNPNNWFNPNDPTGVNQQVNIPGSCTNVLIPLNDQQGIQITRFPNLNTGTTDFSVYSTARCNNIHFDHGGEIQKVDNLVYSNAYVKLDIESNRWYCFSAPLQNFYSGDIYKTDGNPFVDGVFVYERLFSQSHPNWGGSYIDGTWGMTFSQPAHHFLAGEGVSLWVDDLAPNVTTKTSQNFAFPKADTFYNYYNPDGTFLDGPIPIPIRKFSNRFIFESTINNSTKDVLLEVEARTSGIGKEILVGNPYMAHLNFDAFYAANSTKIQPYYRLIDADGNYSTYRIAGGSTGNPVLTADIPPMQSILVTPRVAISSANYLKVNGSMTQQIPGSKLRYADANASSFLRIFISDTELRNRTSLIVDSSTNGSTIFDEARDIMKVITSGEIEYPSIYLLTADDKYADIKTVSTLDGLSFRLGFASGKEGPMAIGFETENISKIINEYDVVLIDKYLNRENLITQYQPIYCFDKIGNTRLTDDRFELRFLKKGSGVEETLETFSNISCQVIGGTLFVATLNASDIINDVLVYDLDGRLIYKKSPNVSSLSFNLPSGVFAVKIATETEVEVKKVIVK